MCGIGAAFSSATNIGSKLIETPWPGTYDAVAVGVAYQQSNSMGIEAIHSFGKLEPVVYDVMSRSRCWPTSITPHEKS